MCTCPSMYVCITWPLIVNVHFCLLFIFLPITLLQHHQSDQLSHLYYIHNICIIGFSSCSLQIAYKSITYVLYVYSSVLLQYIFNWSHKHSIKMYAKFQSDLLLAFTKQVTSCHFFCNCNAILILDVLCLTIHKAWHISFKTVSTVNQVMAICHLLCAMFNIHTCCVNCLCCGRLFVFIFTLVYSLATPSPTTTTLSRFWCLLYKHYMVN